MVADLAEGPWLAGSRARFPSDLEGRVEALQQLPVRAACQRAAANGPAFTQPGCCPGAALARIQFAYVQLSLSARQNLVRRLRGAVHGLRRQRGAGQPLRPRRAWRLAASQTREPDQAIPAWPRRMLGPDSPFGRDLLCIWPQDLLTRLAGLGPVGSARSDPAAPLPPVTTSNLRPLAAHRWPWCRVRPATYRGRRCGAANAFASPSQIHLTVSISWNSQLQDHHRSGCGVSQIFLSRQAFHLHGLLRSQGRAVPRWVPCTLSGPVGWSRQNALRCPSPADPCDRSARMPPMRRCVSRRRSVVWSCPGCMGSNRRASPCRAPIARRCKAVLARPPAPWASSPARWPCAQRASKLNSIARQALQE